MDIMQEYIKLVKERESRREKPGLLFRALLRVFGFARWSARISFSSEVSRTETMAVVCCGFHISNYIRAKDGLEATDKPRMVHTREDEQHGQIAFIF